MRLSRGLSFSTVFLCSILIPVAATARSHSSWCVTGDPMSKTGSSDPTTNQVVSYVCGTAPGQAGLPTCCTSRWTLLCVQAAADYYLNTVKQGDLVSGDFCGRYAWTIGPVANGKQQYPRDFNVFALASDATSFTDVQGPVAAAGKVTANSFGLSGGRQEQVALVGKGDVDIQNGTVYGAIYYGGTYNDHRTVTVVNPSLPGSPPVLPVKGTGGISFDVASSRLSNMSTKIKNFDAIARTKPDSRTVKFVGTDEELNVFSLAASDLTNVTSYIFDVPKGSHVIINVSGTTSATLMNAGFTGPNGGGLSGIPTAMNRILWNFPQITSLTLQSVGFPGSILAPVASATFKWGSLTGTAVVKSAASSSELYMARYQIPGRGGCLDLDPEWSCSNDTTLDYATKRATGIAPEAGFLSLGGGSYTAEDVVRTTPNHRMWYSFQPCLYTPKEKPLVVLFNGGPGQATSSLMFSFNTATYTLDPDVTGSGKIGYNSNSSWTRFANLLYIDAPATGFSYPLPLGTGPQDIGIDIDRDAGFFLRFIVQFLARHPALQDNRVIVAGESYGGTRATLMLYYLYKYELLSNGGLPYQDDQLRQDLLGYFRAVFNKESVTAAEIATKFGHQILIQPGVVGERQQNNRNWSPTGCAPPPICTGTRCPKNCYDSGYDNNNQYIGPVCSAYDCDKLLSQSGGTDWLLFQEEKAAQSLNTVANLNQALGVDATTIKWMRKENRVGAFGREGGFSSVDMIKAFGNGNANDVLPAGDNYFVKSNSNVLRGYGSGAARDWYSAGDSIGLDFLNNALGTVSSFITVTKFDTVIWSPSIALALNSGTDPNSTPPGPFSGIVKKGGVVYSASDATFLSDRPGAMTISYMPAGLNVKVAMPTSYVSGHTVSARAASAANLLADVMNWYSHTPQ